MKDLRNRKEIEKIKRKKTIDKFKKFIIDNKHSILFIILFIIIFIFPKQCGKIIGDFITNFIGSIIKNINL